MFLNNMENDIVLESTFKEKVDNIIDKIKKFIAKIINWIKTKVYGFLKIENVSISKEKYDRCMNILNKLDKVKNKDELDDLRDSRDYKHINFNDGSNMIVIKTNTLKNEVNSLNGELSKLNDGINNLEPADVKVKQFQIELITTKVTVINAIINTSKTVIGEWKDSGKEPKINHKENDSNTFKENMKKRRSGKVDKHIMEEIEDRDISSLRSAVVSTINEEYVWGTDVLQPLLNEIKNAGIDLSEPYQKQEDEVIYHDKNKWTREYYQLLLLWLRDNFAFKKRYPHIKEVAEYVYKNNLI